MGLSVSKFSTSITPPASATTSQPFSPSKVVEIKENANSKSKQKPVTHVNLQLAKMCYLGSCNTPNFIIYKKFGIN